MELKKDEIDVLIEIANIGSGKASKGLSVLSGCIIEPMKPQIMVISEANIESTIDGTGDKVVYGEVDISGNICGKAVFVFSQEHATHLIKVITKKQELLLEETFFRSGIEEIFNIFTGNYLSAMGDILNLKIMHSPPRLLYEASNNIIDLIFEKHKIPEVICIKSVITFLEYNITGFFMLVLDEHNMKALLSEIRKRN
jgi:chemotaxis protein CheC